MSLLTEPRTSFPVFFSRPAFFIILQAVLELKREKIYTLLCLIKIWSDNAIKLSI